MDPAILQAAEAFSGHDFEAAFELLADDVHWDNIGAEQLSGKPAVIEACRASADYLTTVTTTFLRSRTIDGGTHVVIDTLAEYFEPDGDSTTVGSCDIYAVGDGRISTITSYNVEVG
ncbi:MAG TPA: nuclear transport factor 2 family protein [Thermoleophilaceae bacterium]|nr:nuclear transport factor 2 family protein [Thermoleophilaceae bacterium]